MSDLMQCFEKLKIAQNYRDPATSENYFRNLGFATCMRELDDINAAFRGLPSYSHDRGRRVGSVSVTNGRSIIYVPPHHEDVEPLYEDAFTVAQQLPDIRHAAGLMYVAHNLTHRNWEGNLRTAATVHLLLSSGYDGSRRAKGVLKTIAKGREGIQQLGMEMNLSYLQATFAETAFDQLREYYGYDEVFASGTVPFQLRDIHEAQPHMAPHNARHTAVLFKESYMRGPLSMHFMLSLGMRVKDFLRRDGYSERYLLDVPSVVRKAPLREFEGGLFLQDRMRKRQFVRSIINAFQGRESIYAHNGQELLAKLQPASQRA